MDIESVQQGPCQGDCSQASLEGQAQQAPAEANSTGGLFDLVHAACLALQICKLSLFLQATPLVDCLTYLCD